MTEKNHFLYVMICDRETDYLNRMNDRIHVLSEKNQWNVQVDLFSDAVELLHCIKKQKKYMRSLPDIVFSDIRLAQMDGVTLGKRLHEISPRTCLVFITAYADYAIKGYEAGAYRYLLKPVKENQLLQVFRDYLKDRIDTRRWIVKSSAGDLVIELQDIVYMSAEDKYTVIHTICGDYLERDSLNILEQRLTQYGFYRIHRKYLVNMRHHKEFKDKKVLLTDDILLSVSRRKESLYYGALLNRLEQGLL